MNSRSPFLCLLAAFCVLAQVCTQINGAIIGYFCECEGKQVWTAMDHCHGPHGADCHSEGACNRTHSGEDEKDRANHAVVQADESARPIPALAAPFAEPVLLIVLPSLIVPICERDIAILASIEEDSPPSAIAVARTVSLQI